MGKYIIIIIGTIFFGCSVYKNNSVTSRNSFYFGFDEFYGDTISLLINNDTVLKDQVIINPRFDNTTGKYEDRPYSSVKFNNDSLIVNIEGHKRHIQDFREARTLSVSVKKRSIHNYRSDFKKEFKLKKGRFFLIENFRIGHHDNRDSTLFRVRQFLRQPLID